MAHTAGPFRYEAATKTIRSVPANYWLASMDSWDGAVDHAANAILFAAAPTMLDALYTAKARLQEEIDDDPEASMLIEARDEVAAAIDLANGETVEPEPVYDHRDDTVDALTQAESFIEGFEGDEAQEPGSIAELLLIVRAAIKREQEKGAAVAQYDAELNRLEIAPNGDDYNAIVGMFNGAPYAAPHVEGR